MGIKLANGEVVDLLFDKVFLVSLKITQDLFMDDSLPPIYHVEAYYRIYAVAPYGQRHYQSATHPLVIRDFLAYAQKQYADQADPLQLQLMDTLQRALAQWIATKEGTASVT